MKVQLLMPAAGAGQRIGGDIPKALLPLHGIPLFVHTLKRLEAAGLLENTAILTIPGGHREDFDRAFRAAFPHASVHLVPGGAERQDSVENGLAALDPDTALVVIHDAARPFVSVDAIKRSIEAAGEHGAATVAVPAVDTILEGDADHFLASTPDRSRLWACQTPQTFRVEVIRQAHAQARHGNYSGTDDASLVRRQGNSVKLVLGTALNFKVTTREQVRLAECILKEGLA